MKQEDTIVRTYDVEIDKRSGVTNLHGKQSVRRYFRGNSVVIVRKSIMTPAGGNGAQFVENGWIVISPVPGQQATVTRECSTISPLGRSTECGIITEGMISARKDLVDKAFQVLENILFEEAGKCP